MPQRNLKRVLDPIVYALNGTDTLDLPRENTYRRLQLRIIGSVTIAGGAASGTVVEYSPATLIKRIEVIVNGSQTIKSISGKQLFIQNSYDYQGDAELSTLANGDIQASTAIAAVLNLDFELPRKAPIQSEFTLLNSSKQPPITMSSLELKITFGSGADIISGGDRTVTVDATTIVQVMTDERVPQTLAQLRESYAVNKETNFQQSIVSSNVELSLKGDTLPLGNTYNRIWLIAYNNSLRSDALITNIKLRRNGVDTLLYSNFLQEKNQDAADYKIKKTDLKTGVCFIDFDRKGLLNELLDVKNANSLELLVDTIAPTGTAWIEAVLNEITP